MGIGDVDAVRGPRHHASWLLAGGADLQVVMERLGHLNQRQTAAPRLIHHHGAAITEGTYDAIQVP